ncbi:HAD family hydrolase [Actinomadura rupiterrae]|uniref:HAD family hydrolase n=1 Tax=Actinomadura rupiterrae TaxID=559627 RepID=UPI0020A3FBD5|nr:HAD family hydrolase [Actinomadura rupiterrae]MCP2341827.1 putative hydrolase of the HAD superfamily [Actinomadura rupiterrae]
MPLRTAAVLFDLDGTLMDHATAATRAILECWPGADTGFVERRWNELTDGYVERYARGEMSFAEQRRRRAITLARELGHPGWDDAKADAWFAGYLARYQGHWAAFPDVLPLFEELAARGLRFGIVTNGDGSQQRRKLERIGVLPHVADCVMASREVGAAKPDAAIFTAACARLGLPPDAVLHVGDLLDTDARGAAAAGLTGVWLDRPGTGTPADVARITTLADLPGLLL